MSPLTSREPGVVGAALYGPAAPGAGSSSTGAMWIRWCSSSPCAAGPWIASSWSPTPCPASAATAPPSCCRARPSSVRNGSACFDDAWPAGRLGPRHGRRPAQRRDDMLGLDLADASRHGQPQPRPVPAAWATTSGRIAPGYRADLVLTWTITWPFSTPGSADAKHLGGLCLERRWLARGFPSPARGSTGRRCRRMRGAGPWRRPPTSRGASTPQPGPWLGGPWRPGPGRRGPSAPWPPRMPRRPRRMPPPASPPTSSAQPLLVTGRRRQPR